MNANWLDWIIVAWLVAGAWKGLRSGLLLGGARLVGLVLSLAVAVRFAAPLASRLETATRIDEGVQAILRAGGLVSPEVAALPAAAGAGVLRDLLRNGLLPGGSLPVLAPDPGQTFGDYLYALLAHLALRAAAFLALVLLVSAAAGLAGRLLRGTVGRLPLLGAADRAGGLVLGLAQSAALAAVVAGVAAPLARFLPGAGAAEAVSRSLLVPPLVRLYGLLAGLVGL